MKTRRVCVLVVLLALVAPVASCAEFGAGWAAKGGDWGWTREIIPMIRQGSDTGTAVAFCKEVNQAQGAWRATVAPALGAKEVGVWVQGSQDLKSGFLVVLGGNPGIGGFALKSPDGKTLWEDKYAPWIPYEPYVLEGVVERGRVRAQMFASDGKTLLSQGPWVDVPEPATETPGMIGLYTRDGIARFWSVEHSPQPLSPIVADAPNKRRLIQDEKSPWVIVGPGNWMWTTGEKNRLRQYAVIERSSAINRATWRPGRHTWECHVKVDPDAGGAGMLFQVNENADQGFIAWLGGKYGAGTLMLYELPTQCLWAGKQDNWHYNTEYLLRAETRAGEVRAQLLQADGKTLIQETPWVKNKTADAEGFVGLQTWKGTAEFWGFSEETKAVAGAAPSAMAGPVSQLGGSWATVGDGSWQWADEGRTRLRQTANVKQAVAMDTGISGAIGVWRCLVRVPAGTDAAGLVFQANPGISEGFACVLSEGGFKLENLSGKTLWEDAKCAWTRGTAYLLEGEVMVDRVAVRLFSADGKDLLCECPAVYVSEANNHRMGHLGMLTRGGPAEFAQWGVK